MIQVRLAADADLGELLDADAYDDLGRRRLTADAGDALRTAHPR